MLRTRRFSTQMLCTSSPALCGLRGKAQQRVHRKRFGQIRQRVKLRKATRADTDGRKDHHRQLLTLSLHHQGLDTSLAESSAQDIPACLVGKVDIEDNQIKRSSTQIYQCCMSILR